MCQESLKCDSAVVTHGRRQFLRLATLTAGVGLFSPMLPSGQAMASGKTEALLLSCMDFRLMDDIEKYMSGRGLRDKYDHVILAGASLGAVTDRFPAWNKTFWEHLDISIDLHHIQKVILMDHRDCGAYKVILGEDFAKTPERETGVHTKVLRHLAKAIKEKQPKLEVEMLLMALDGKVESIAAG